MSLIRLALATGPVYATLLARDPEVLGVSIAGIPTTIAPAFEMDAAGDAGRWHWLAADPHRPPQWTWRCGHCRTLQHACVEECTATATCGRRKARWRPAPLPELVALARKAS